MIKHTGIATRRDANQTPFARSGPTLASWPNAVLGAEVDSVQDRCFWAHWSPAKSVSIIQPRHQQTRLFIFCSTLTSSLK